MATKQPNVLFIIADDIGSVQVQSYLDLCEVHGRP